MKILLQHQQGKCPIAKSKGASAFPEELHHSHLHNREMNRKRFPLLIDSLWNLVAVSHKYHMENGSWTPTKRWSLAEADERERFLQRHPAIAGYLNP